MPFTQTYLCQGEERDSSDDEWDIAYAAMDPRSQLGWGNTHVEVEGPAAQLVRDVFVAADAMHDDAMSHMGGNSSIGGDSGGGFDVDSEESCSSSADHAPDAGCHHYGNIQGE